MAIGWTPQQRHGSVANPASIRPASDPPIAGYVFGRGGIARQPAIIRAQSCARSWSVMPGNSRRNSTAAASSPPFSKTSRIAAASVWPLARAAPSWRADAIDFRMQAADRFAPSMRQRLDLSRIYQQAVRALPEAMDGQPPLPVPEVCPLTLDELLSEP
jgi:Domain of unknown function DUF29